MLRELLVLFLGVLISLKLLYEFREVPPIGRYLSTWVAILLTYAPVGHVTLRKIPISFFEKKLSSLVSSLFFFVVTSLVLFPLFLLANHFYQRIFFGRHLTVAFPDISIEMIVVQVVLIAFPEEFFFRGYLQTLLARIYPKKILSIGWAVPLTSLLFALSHSLITFRWWHFSIFFPSLVFGWLREKTNGLVAPVLFHALSNLIVAWVGAAYR